MPVVGVVVCAWCCVCTTCVPWCALVFEYRCPFVCSIIVSELERSSGIQRARGPGKETSARCSTLLARRYALSPQSSHPQSPPSAIRRGQRDPLAWGRRRSPREISSSFRTKKPFSGLTKSSIMVLTKTSYVSERNEQQQQ